MKMPPISFDVVPLSGGLDLVTPSLSLKSGVARDSLNFECSVTGGYTRIAGYERFDGRPSPSSLSSSFTMMVVESVSSSGSWVPTIGLNVLGATTGSTGTIAYVEAVSGYTTNEVGQQQYLIGLVDTVGDFTSGALEDVALIFRNGSTVIGFKHILTLSPDATRLQYAKLSAATADHYRTEILAVPGYGPILGVVEYNDTVYAFRTDVTNDHVDIYKSSDVGWVQVPYLATVEFTNGADALVPQDGDTLTQGAVSTTIYRCAKRSGEWTGDAAGIFVIAQGVPFVSGPATVGTATVTLTPNTTTISLAKGGKFEFVEGNLFGSPDTRRLYACDGVNQAFEFDGTVVAPIATGEPIDAPTHVEIHNSSLFLAIGSNLFYSAPGDPYNWERLATAGFVQCGDEITGIKEVPGSVTSAGLAVSSRYNSYILYGTSDTDFNLVTYNTGTGAISGTMNNMSQTLAMDDRGIQSMQVAFQYGNFTQNTLSWPISPFIRDHVALTTCATLAREKSQYRVFFSDGYGIYSTIINGKHIGSMVTSFPDPVLCVYEGKRNDGSHVIYFGSDSGYVFQMDKGTSFDGKNIFSMLRMNYSHARSPRVLKRFRKAAIEIASVEQSFVDLSFGYTLGYDSAYYSTSEDYNATLQVSARKWDSGQWDNGRWDGLGIGPMECEVVGTAENIAIMIYSDLNYIDPYTANSMMIHYTQRRAMR